MDGINASDDIMVIASTNRKDAIDSALLRPGRLDKLVEVALPGEKEREEIFSVHLHRANEIAQIDLFENINLGELARSTARYSGADIAEIVRRTLEQKVRLESNGQTTFLVQTNDILDKIKSYEHIRPTSSQRMGFRT